MDLNSQLKLFQKNGSKNKMKICVKCDKEKIISEFSQRKDRPTKSRNYCKSCDNLKRQNRYKENILSEREGALKRYNADRPNQLVKLKKNHLKRQCKRLFC